MTNPVLLLHGFTGSVQSTWVPTGIIELLSDAGREVIAWDLPGHGAAEKHHEPEAYAGMEEMLVERLPEGQVDGVGFSMGARTLLCMAAIAPDRFGKLVVAGVGRNLFERDEAQAERIAKGVQGEASDDDVHAQTFARYAAEPDQDGIALSAFMRSRFGKNSTPCALASTRFRTTILNRSLRRQRLLPTFLRRPGTPPHNPGSRAQTALNRCPRKSRDISTHMI